MRRPQRVRRVPRAAGRAAVVAAMASRSPSGCSQADGLLIRRIEANGLGQLQHGGHRRLQALDAPMGNRHAMTQAGGAQALARKQAVGDERAAG
nr:hypothetical protein [Mycobacterium tuberculosis]